MATINLNNCFPLGADGSRGPLPKQKAFIDLVLDPKGPKHVGYYGGYGSGKSLVLCVVMITQAVMHGGEYVIGRQFAPELKRTTMKLFLELLPKELLIEHRVADAEVHLRAANGKRAVVYFVGLDEPGKLDSLTLSGWAIDEASQVSEEAFLKLQGRLRSVHGLRKGIIVGNPKGHDWAYRRFVSKVEIRDEDKNKYQMIVAPTTENRHLPPDYLEGMLSSYSKERIQRDIMGSFDSFEGMVYSEFSRNVHVIPPFKVPSSWTRIIGADHGFTNPAAFLWGAVDYDGNIYIYREFYKREWLIKEICQGREATGEPGIVSLSKEEKIEGIWIDPSTKARRGQTGGSDWDNYLDYLPRTMGLLPANNEVEAGLDRVKTYLRVNATTGKPRLFIFETCPNLIDEISEYRYQELSAGQAGKANDKEAPRKYKDHAVDAMRYMLMSRPDTPKIRDKNKPKLEAATLEGSLMREWDKLRNPKPKDPYGDW